MQTTRNLQLETTAQAGPAVLTQVKTTSRLVYIDTIRTILIVLVIMVHAAVTYGSLGSWVYEDPKQDEIASILLSFFVIGCQAFFMGLYFFFSGVFTPGSYDRKGLGSFWKDRLIRLGIPVIAYTWFLCKIPNYINDVANEGLQMSFGQYFSRNFWSLTDEGPTWFIFTLLIFSAAYTLWRLATQKVNLGSRFTHLPAPTIPLLLGFGLVMAGLMFAVSQVFPVAEPFDLFGIFSLLLSFFPQYILLFIAGILVYRTRKSAEGDWLARIPAKSLRFWIGFSTALALLLPVLLFAGGAPDGHMGEFMTGLNLRCALFNLWIGLACVSFSVTLILLLRDRVTPRDRLTAFAGPNTFTVYLIHPLILVPITYALSFLAIPTLAKFGLASTLTVIACFLAAEGLRRLKLA